MISEIKKRIANNERTLITTLTIRMSEDLTDYLKDIGIKVTYLHSNIKSLDRIEIIRELRQGVHDVIVGINLLREGLDLPEVSLIAILDADKEGFLRSERSLIQTIGRAARNINGTVLMYADKITDSMQKAIDETNRRRTIQLAYNEANNITPQTISKPIPDTIRITTDSEGNIDPKRLSLQEKQALISNIEKEMRQAAKTLDFEHAAMLRDLMMELKGNI